MSRLNYKEFYPINFPEELLETKFKNLNDFDLKKWNNFKNRIPHSGFIKKSLKNRQSNICPVCSKFLNENIVAHHIDYDRLCDFETYEKQKAPTSKNPNRELKVPKCESCSNSNICLDKLVLIHNSCHMILHKQEGRISKNLEKKNKILFPKEKRKYDLVPREWWLSKTKLEILDLVEEILRQINNNSELIFSIQYNKHFIELKPENIIYFKPLEKELKITVSYGKFGKWHKELNKKGIDSKIYKHTSRKFSFTIDYNQYLENIDLIKDIINDTLNKSDNDNDDDSLEYSPQMTLF